MNEFETTVAVKLKRLGWQLMTSGWPDFLCWKENLDNTKSIMGVEVKNKHDKLSVKQVQNHDILRSAGLPITIITYEDLFVQGTFEDIPQRTTNLKRSRSILVHRCAEARERVKPRHCDCTLKIDNSQAISLIKTDKAEWLRGRRVNGSFYTSRRSIVLFSENLI